MDILQKKISFISLGCDKNKVDLEEMMYSLSSFGFTFSDIKDAQIAIVNTCAFILTAREEAINNVLEMVQLKKAGQLEKIVVTGCLCQRYLAELKKFLPEVDRFVQLKENKDIVEIIAQLYDEEPQVQNKDIKNKNKNVQSQISKQSSKQNKQSNKQNKQLLVSTKHYAYLKISDGCNNCCAYCTIPMIRGRYTSMPFNDVIARAKQLVADGAKELIIVAQDTTRYGIDLYKKYRLIELLEEISKIKNLKWIRLHYCYPELVSDELLEFISNNKKICPYIDIPLQHVDNKILKEMNRKSSEDTIRKLVSNIKTNYPDIAIRSTFIVGFPGESRKQFKKLCDFLKESKLDNVGFFAYSREERTKAFYMKKQKSQRTKNKRIKIVQKIQDRIATEKNRKMIGQTVQVLVDNFNFQTGYYEAHADKMSPNVDYYINISPDQNIKIGEFYDVTLLSYENYAFFGKIV
jgi:ribosomal protein S12 methylthiotransferase